MALFPGGKHYWHQRFHNGGIDQLICRYVIFSYKITQLGKRSPLSVFSVLYVVQVGANVDIEGVAVTPEPLSDPTHRGILLQVAEINPPHFCAAQLGGNVMFKVAIIHSLLKCLT